MNIEQYREVATPIITEGFANGLSDDDLKMELMVAGVPYSALNAVTKNIAIEKKLIADPKEVTNGINEKLEQYQDWEAISEYPDLADLAQSISDAVEGSTVGRVVTLARAYCKNEFELELPKKPRTGGGGSRVGKIAMAVVALFAENKSPTKQEFYDAMVPVVGGDQQHANIIYYMGLYMSVATAIASGQGLEAVSAELAKQANPAPGEGVSAEPRGSKGEEAEEDDTEEGDEGFGDFNPE